MAIGTVKMVHDRGWGIIEQDDKKLVTVYFSDAKGLNPPEIAPIPLLIGQRVEFEVEELPLGQAHEKDGKAVELVARKVRRASIDKPPAAS